MHNAAVLRYALRPADDMVNSLQGELGVKFNKQKLNVALEIALTTVAAYLLREILTTNIFWILSERQRKFYYLTRATSPKNYI